MGPIGESLLTAVLRFLSQQLARILDWLWGILTATVFVSPDVTGLPQIQHVSGVGRAVVNASMVLVVAVVGALHLLTGGSQRSQYTLRTLGPRFAVSIVAANCGPLIVSVSITAANAVTGALTGTDFTTQQTIEQIRTQLTSIRWHPDQVLLQFALHNCMTIALAALLVTWLVRVGQLIVVAAVAPIALACHTFPATQVVAEGWWRTLAGALVTQVLQAVTLTLAWTTLVSPDASLPVVIGLPVDPGGSVNLMLAAFLTAQVALIPRYVRRMLPAGRGGAALGAVFRMLVVQQVMHGLRGARRRPAAAGVARSAIRDTVHLHTAGERQVTNLYGEGAVQHTHERGAHQHVHERGSSQYTHHHVHQAAATPPPARAT
ncbi:MAG: hypothetical protein HOV79_31985, partial [Hamadaea sp.]|nr:hypothetical protein [Hamadaea sp.]